MAIGEHVEEIVNILSLYFNGQLDMLRTTYGDQAPMLAEEMADMLEELVVEETPFSQLWVEFRDEPLEHDAELIGALEMLEESVPVVSVRLEGYYAGFAAMRNEDAEIIESTEPEGDDLELDELRVIKSIDDGDNDDEYREDTTYLVGNVEDRSTSAMYIEGLDTDVEPNQTEDD